MRYATIFGKRISEKQFDAACNFIKGAFYTLLIVCIISAGVIIINKACADNSGLDSYPTIEITAYPGFTIWDMGKVYCPHVNIERFVVYTESLNNISSDDSWKIQTGTKILVPVEPDIYQAIEYMERH